MPKIRLENKENRIQKVALTKLFQVEAGLALETAKSTTDTLLEEGTVEVPVGTLDAAKRIVAKAEELGVSSRIVDE